MADSADSGDGAGSSPRASSTNASRVWIPDIVGCIASHLPPNVVACTLRLVDKATAAQLSAHPRHTTIRLSQPVPHHAFARAWAGSGRPMRTLNLPHRQALLQLTAATGDLRNLEVAAANAGFVQKAEALEAAAAAGHLDVCLELHRRRCTACTPGNPSPSPCPSPCPCPSPGLWGDALALAAAEGRQDVCEGLLAAGCEWSWRAACAAARCGHAGLMEWLVARCPAGSRRGFMSRSEHLVSVARGCDLGTLQKWYLQWLELPVPRVGGLVLAFLPRCYCVQLLPAAAASPSPDWRAKVEWLEGAVASPRTAAACYEAVGCSDAASRLAWLRQRGYPVDGVTAVHAAKAGNEEVLRSLLAAGIEPKGYAAIAAAAGGHLSVLRALHAAVCRFDWRSVVKTAAGQGHLDVVAWAVETCGGGSDSAALLDVDVAAEAARSGSMALLAWLAERGCLWGPSVFAGAAEAGSEEALEWLAGQGCPPGTDGEPYIRAARNGDLATLRCLRRLGCPWGPAGRVFTDCVDARCPLPVLRWLAEEAGCPVDWRAASKAARERWSRKTPEGSELREWAKRQNSWRERVARRRAAAAVANSGRKGSRWWRAMWGCVTRVVPANES